MLGVVALPSLVMLDWFIHRGLFAQDRLHTIKKEGGTEQKQKCKWTPNPTLTNCVAFAEAGLVHRSCI